MNSKELFMLIDEIDERFIDEAWNSTESESFDEIDYENRRGVKVVMERRPFRAIGYALTAACFLLLGAGGMALINLLTVNGIQPNSSMERPSSYVGSSTSSDSSEDSSLPQDVISDIETTGNYELQFFLPPGGSGWSEETEKLNNLGYAEIVITETKATPMRPIYVQILKSTPKAGMEPLSESIAITGTGTYRIKYTTLRGAGSYSYLYLEYPNRNINGEYLVSGTEIVGTWSP